LGERTDRKEGDYRQRQADYSTGREQREADKREIARTHQAQGTDRDPGRDRDQDKIEVRGAHRRAKSPIVVPAQAETQCRELERRWIPAFAGMTAYFISRAFRAARRCRVQAGKARGRRPTRRAPSPRRLRISSCAGRGSPPSE